MGDKSSLANWASPDWTAVDKGGDASDPDEPVAEIYRREDGHVTRLWSEMVSANCNQVYNRCPRRPTHLLCLLASWITATPPAAHDRCCPWQAWRHYIEQTDALVDAACDRLITRFLQDVPAISPRSAQNMSAEGQTEGGGARHVVDAQPLDVDGLTREQRGRQYLVLLDAMLGFPHYGSRDRLQPDAALQLQALVLLLVPAAVAATRCCYCCCYSLLTAAPPAACSLLPL